MTKYTLEICQEDSHRWGHVELPGCGEHPSLQMLNEVTPISRPDEVEGEVCTQCFQLRGKDQGQQDETLLYVYHRLIELEG